MENDNKTSFLGLKSFNFLSVCEPDYYCKGRKYEPKDVIRDWDLNFNLGNVVKYISRAGRKGDILKDLYKAEQYLKFEIDAIEKALEKDLEKENNARTKDI